MHSIRGIHILLESESEISFLLYNQWQITLAKCKLQNLEITEIGSFYASEAIVGIQVLSDSRIIVFGPEKSIEISPSQFKKVKKWFLSSTENIVSSDISDDSGIWVNDYGLVTFRRGDFVKTVGSKQISAYLGVKDIFLVNQICFFRTNCVVFKFENGMIGLISIDEVGILMLNFRAFLLFIWNIHNYFILSHTFEFYKMNKY